MRRGETKLFSRVLAFVVAVCMFLSVLPVQSLASAGGLLATINVATGVHYTTDQMENEALMMHSSSAGGTKFQNVPEYLNGLYFVQTSTFDAVEATMTADGYAYILASEALVAGLKTSGFVEVATHARADIMTGYWANNRAQVSSTLYLLEKQVSSGDVITYGDGSNWAIMMTSSTKIQINNFLASLSPDTGSCTIGTLSNGATVMTGQAGVFQNLPEYMKGLKYVMNSTWQTVEATATADCYFYALASSNNLAAMTVQGFTEVTTFAKATIFSGWTSTTDTMYLLEKQVNTGDKITYYATYKSGDNGGWGTLITSPTKLQVKKEGLLAELTGCTSSPATGKLADGAEVLYPGIGQTTFQNLPEYLKGLYFAQHRDWTVVTAKAIDDCYFYVLTSEADVEAMKAQGFTQVKTFVQSDIMTGYFVGKPAFSNTLYLMEKEMSEGQSITYRNSTYDGTNTYWGTVITSYEKLDIPADEPVLDGRVLEVTGSEGASINYSVVELNDGALILHKNTAGGTAFQNLPEYLKELYFIQGMSFDAVEATVKTDCYVYALVSEELTDNLKQTGFVQVAHYEKTDILTPDGYFTTRNQVSNTLFLMEKQVANGDKVCYGDGSHWGTLILAEGKLDIPAEDNEPLEGLMVRVTKHEGDNGPYLVEQMADGKTILHPNVAGGTVFQNTPEYLKDLYFVQNSSLMGFEAKAKADGYIYVLAVENLVEELETAGFTQVANYKAKDKITGYFVEKGILSDGLYLMEKQVAEGDVVSWGKEYGNWSILMTSAVKLTIPSEDNIVLEGLQVKVTKHAEDEGPYLVAQMSDGETILHPNVAGGTVFQNTPEYLKNLYFVQNSTLMGFEAKAKSDGYVYILTVENLKDELEVAGFNQVANFKTKDKITGYFVDKGILSEVIYLMEKQVTKGEIISWGEEYGNWSILMTSADKLNIPASDNKTIEGLLVKVTRHADDEGPYLVTQMADGETILHPNVAGGTVFQNLPEYLKGLYFVQNCTLKGFEATAKSDGYIYILADEDLVEELEKAGFKQVANYEAKSKITGYFMDKAMISEVICLMEKSVTKGEVVSWGKEYGDWSTLITSSKQLTIPASDNKPIEGLLVKVTKHADDPGPYLVAQMADGEFVLHPGVSKGNTFRNLPEYLKGLYFVQNCNLTGMQAKAKQNCYVYVLAYENVAIELAKEGFKYVAKYEEGELGEGTHMKEKMYLMEKKLAKGEEISYGEKYGEWGILMTSPKKLTIPEIEPDYDWLSTVYYYNRESGDYYIFHDDKTITYTEDGVTKQGTYRIINPELTTFEPVEEGQTFDLSLEVVLDGDKTTYEFPYFTFTDDSGTEYERLGTYKLRFETGVGSTVETQTLNAQNGYLPTTPENTKSDGNTFKGWYTAEGKEYSFDNMVTESATLYAKWSNADYKNVAGTPVSLGALPYLAACALILGASIGCGVYIIKRGKNGR